MTKINIDLHDQWIAYREEAVRNGKPYLEFPQWLQYNQPSLGIAATAQIKEINNPTHNKK